MNPKIIELSYPPRDLWTANNRKHRLALTKARQAAYWEGYALATSAKFPLPDNPHLVFKFFPSTRRSFDRDNALGAMKNYIDGMAKAFKVDDSEWDYITLLGGTKPGGLVRVMFIDKIEFKDL